MVLRFRCRADTVTSRWTAHIPGRTDALSPIKSGTGSLRKPSASSPKLGTVFMTRHQHLAEASRSCLLAREVPSCRCLSIRSSPSTAESPTTTVASCCSKDRPDEQDAQANRMAIGTCETAGRPYEAVVSVLAAACAIVPGAIEVCSQDDDLADCFEDIQ